MLAGAVGRVVVDHEHAHAERSASARSMRSRFSRSLYVGRQTVARRHEAAATYHRGMAATLLRNADVADQFDLLADLLELEGAESFRVLAYRRAATRIRETSGSVAQLALEGAAKELQGSARRSRRRSSRSSRRASSRRSRSAKAKIPPEVVSSCSLPGPRAEDGRAVWTGARHHDARRAAGRRRGRAAARRCRGSGRRARRRS